MCFWTIKISVQSVYDRKVDLFDWVQTSAVCCLSVTSAPWFVMMLILLLKSHLGQRWEFFNEVQPTWWDRIWVIKCMSEWNRWTVTSGSLRAFQKVPKPHLLTHKMRNTLVEYHQICLAESHSSIHWDFRNCGQHHLAVFFGETPSQS